MIRRVVRWSRMPLRVLTAALSMVLLTGLDAQATSDQDAINACRTALVTEESATRFIHSRVKRNRRVPFVYATVDFPDVSGVYVRCRINKGVVRDIKYLVRSRTAASGRGWSSIKPGGATGQAPETEGLTETPPVGPTPQPPPKFIKVPEN